MPSFLEILKNCAVALTGEIPGSGTMLSVLLDTIWDPSDDVWSQVKENVENLVDEKLSHDESTHAESMITSLKESMTYYKTLSYETDKTEKGNELSIMVDAAKDLRNLFEPGTIGDNDEDNQRMRVTYVLYLVALAPLHLAILKERVQHGAELYDSSGDDARQRWDNSLKTEANNYDAYFPKFFAEWQGWRASKITCHDKRTCVDNLGGRRVQWDRVQEDDKKFNATKQLWMSYETVKIGDILEPTFYLSNAALHDKIEKKVDSKLQDMMTVVSGPLNSSTAGLPYYDTWNSIYYYDNNMDKNRTDTTAPVTRVRTIKSDKGLEGIQLTYGSEGAGRWHGGKNTEKDMGKHQVQNTANVPSGKDIQEVGVWMHNGTITGFRFYMDHNKLAGNQGADFGTIADSDATHKKFYFPLKESTSYQLESMQTNVDTRNHGIETLWLVFKRVLQPPTTDGLKM